MKTLIILFVLFYTTIFVWSEEQCRDTLSTFLSDSLSEKKLKVPIADSSAIIGSLEEITRHPENVERFIKTYSFLEGHRRIAKELFEGRMDQAYQFFKKELTHGQFVQLYWKYFHGTVSKQDSLLSILLDESGNPHKKYRGMTGYYEFAQSELGGNMVRTFANVSASLNKNIFEWLEWKMFTGSARLFDTIRNMKEEEINLYIGSKGLILAADKFFQANLQRAYQGFSSAFGKDFKQFSWKLFSGNVEHLNKIREVIFENGLIKEKYKGMVGYLQAGKDIYGDSDMEKTFKNVSFILGEPMSVIGWKLFQGSSQDFEDLWGLVYRSVISFIKNYKEELEGFDTRELFENETRGFERLWRIVRKKLGMTQGDKEIFRDLVYESVDEFIERYKTPAGQLRFLKDFNWSKNSSKIHNVSVILAPSRYKQLGWRTLNGPISNLDRIAKVILNSKEGTLKEEHLEQYRSLRGQALATDNFFEGRQMRYTYNAFIFLLGRDFVRDELGWVQFFGTSRQLHLLIAYYDEFGIDGFRGVEMQKRVANEIFKGNNSKAYREVFAVRNHFLIEDFSSLGWVK